MVFHIVSRTHHGEPWFTAPLRTGVAQLIAGMIGRSDARLLAYAVMPNHLHVILRQGRESLGDVMQPLLRRVALRVQRVHGFRGAVVERRFRDRMCRDPDHLREALVYAHLNPWRARLCDDPLGYRWTTHAAYTELGEPPEFFGLDPHAHGLVLELFGGTGRPKAALRRDYDGYVRFRMNQGVQAKHDAPVLEGDPPPHRPSTSAGDRAWRLHFAGRLDPSGDGWAPGLLDLRDFVLSQLEPEDDVGRIEEIRGSWLPRKAARTRARILRIAAGRGYRTSELARFFAVSPATVSKAKYGQGPGR